MHKSILVLPAFTGSLALYRKLAGVLPARLRCSGLELAEATRHLGYFDAPTVGTFTAAVMREQRAEFADPDIVVSSCGGSLLALEFCAQLRRQGKAPELLILIDPPVWSALFASRGRLEFWLQALREFATAAPRIFKHRRWLRDSQDPTMRYRMILRLRAAFFHPGELPCPTCVVISQDRAHETRTALLRTNGHALRCFTAPHGHRELFSGAGLAWLAATLEGILAEAAP